MYVCINAQMCGHKNILFHPQAYAFFLFTYDSSGHSQICRSWEFSLGQRNLHVHMVANGTCLLLQNCEGRELITKTHTHTEMNNVKNEQKQCEWGIPLNKSDLQGFTRLFRNTADKNQMHITNGIHIKKWWQNPQPKTHCLTVGSKLHLWLACLM